MSWPPEPLERLEFARLAHDFVDMQKAYAGPVRYRKAVSALDAAIIGALRDAGAALPPPLAARAHRRRLLREAALAREKAEAPGLTCVEPIKPKLSSLAVLARAATVLLVIVALLFTVGLASTYAMPGNPLYSVKRWVERLHLAFLSPGYGEANTHLSYAMERLDELEHVQKKSMKSWYFPLLTDAGDDIERCLDEAKTLSTGDYRRLAARARGAHSRLEMLLGRISSDLSASQLLEVNRMVERQRQRLMKGQNEGSGGDGGESGNHYERGEPGPCDGGPARQQGGGEGHEGQPADGQMYQESGDPADGRQKAGERDGGQQTSGSTERDAYPDGVKGKR